MVRKSNNVFDYYPSEKEIVGLVSIPHSGEWIPDPFLKYLTTNKRALMEDVDLRVNELVDISGLNKNGIAVLVARVHRACVDLNRDENIAALNWKNNSKGLKLVTEEPTENQIKAFTEEYYAPYYNILKDLVDELVEKNKKPPVIDLHSMPSVPTEYHLRINPNQKMERPDFCVSDLNGISCDRNYLDSVLTELKKHGFNAISNDPYLGGFITRYLSELPVNNVQIETKRSLYMDEVNKELKVEKVEKLKSTLTSVIVKIMCGH